MTTDVRIRNQPITPQDLKANIVQPQDMPEDARVSLKEQATQLISRELGRHSTPADIIQLASEQSNRKLARVLVNIAGRYAKTAQEVGVAQIDHYQSSEEELTQEEIEALMNTEPDMENYGRLPQLDLGAVTINTGRMELEDGAVTIEKVKEASGPRYCVGAWLHHFTGDDTYDMRAERIEVVMPPSQGFHPEDLGEDPSNELLSLAKCMPMPMRGGEIDYRQLNSKRANNSLGTWQRNRIQENASEYIETQGKIRVFTDPESRCGHGFTSYKLLIMDEEYVRQYTNDVGEVHYLSGLVSGGGYAAGTQRPDYREYPYLALEPEHISRIAELLGVGVYEAGEIGDGRSMLLLPEWPEDDYIAQETQMRAITGYREQLLDQSDFDRSTKLTMSKGMVRPVHPNAIDWALTYYENEIVGTEDEEYYSLAADMLDMVKSQDEPVLTLVQGDQVKVGTANGSGRALMCGTFLKGNHDTMKVDTEEGSYLRPAPQYVISGNSQVTGFLKPSAENRLEENIKTEAKIIQGKCCSIKGGADIASESTRVKLDEEVRGDREYRAGADELSDAFLGGGVRMTGQGWLESMQGNASPENIHMFPSTKRRFSKAVASYIKRRLMNGFGIYGYGYHHATIKDDQELLLQLWGYFTGLPEPRGASDVPDKYLDYSRKNLPQPLLTPWADRSVNVMPKKVTGKMNADDDGDITTSLAAEYNVGTEENPVIVKAIMSWRYPAVDAPIFWCVPKGTRTPYDGKDQEERERFKRILDIYRPKLKDGEPAPEENGITILNGTGTWRLSDMGAKSFTSKIRREGELTQESAKELTDTKRDLNQAGPLTRDLERFGDMMSMITKDAIQKKRNGHENLLGDIKEIFKRTTDRAHKVSKNIEKNLTAFKYRQEKIESADITLPAQWYPDYSDAKQIRQRQLPLSYHDITDTLNSLSRPRSSKAIENPSVRWFSQETNPYAAEGDSRFGNMLARIFDGPVQDIVDTVESISTARKPFLQALSRFLKRFGEDATNEEKKAVQEEGEFVQRICEFYRSYWRLMYEETGEMVDEAKDKEEARERQEEILSEAGQYIQLQMQAFSPGITAEGLAYGVYKDIQTYRDENGNDISNSTSAASALLSGRMGEVLLPPEVQQGEPLKGSHIRHIVVFRRGEVLPVDKYGQSVELDKARVHTGKRQVAAKLGNEVFTLHVAEGEQLPDAILGDVFLAKTSDKQGVLYWRQG